MSNIKFKISTCSNYKIWRLNCPPFGQKRAVIAYDLKMRFVV
jgi:hypothetical protein